jgi:hypothetical protein
MRSCDGCTECCKGYVSGYVRNKPFYAGHACHYMGEKGCTIYKDRPHDPCVAFKCGWLLEEELFPEWFKPSVSKVLIVKLKTDRSKIDFYRIVECGQKLDAMYLNYLFLCFLNKKINIQVYMLGGVTNYGSPEFLEDIKHNFFQDPK